MPVSWVPSINPVMIIALAPVFAAVGTKLGPRRPSTNTAPLLGLIAIAVGAAVLLATRPIRTLMAGVH